MALQRDETARFLCDVPAAAPVAQVLDVMVGLHNELQRMRRCAHRAPRYQLGAWKARHLDPKASKDRPHVACRGNSVTSSMSLLLRRPPEALGARNTYEPEPGAMGAVNTVPDDGRLCAEGSELCRYGPARPPAEVAALAAAAEEAAAAKLRADGAPIVVDTPAALKVMVHATFPDPGCIIWPTCWASLWPD